MIAQLPPMGWNSWNTFGKDISEELLFQITDTIIEEGYREAGYEYVIVDDCWALKERDPEGNLVPDPEKFPHGMKTVADYIHSKGLKFGIYSCAGILTCAGYPSSYDHEYQDARQFARWGVDYLKYDFCNFPDNADCKNRYLTMSMALKASGREILFAACNWGTEDSWNWIVPSALTPIVPQEIFLTIINPLYGFFSHSCLISVSPLLSVSTISIC